MSRDLFAEYLGHLDDSGESYKADQSEGDYTDGEDDVTYESDESMGVHDPDSDDDPEAWDWKLPGFDPPTTRESPVHEFTKPAAGQTDKVPQFTHPVEAFRILVDYEVVSHIVDCTNEKAHHYITETGKDRINSLKWKNVDTREMYVFIALTMVMGVVVMPRIHMYWNHHLVWGGPQIFCATVMSRNRFYSIMKFLRFSRLGDVIVGNPRSRIEPFLEILRRKCQEALHVGEHIAIDESLILWKGRLHFRQFIKTKRKRFGIKVYFLCPADQKLQGYSWDFEVYYGASNYNVADGYGDGLTKSEEIVVYLMRELLDDGRHVITDNWYTSLRLALYLDKKKTTLTGTLRADRGAPAKLRNERLQSSQSAFVRKGNVLISKYEDKKSVYSLSTRYHAMTLGHTQYFHGDKVKFFHKPIHIELYNQFMGSIDKADQMLEQYSFDGKTLAWFKKLGLHFLERSNLNAYILYKLQNSTYEKDYLFFVKEVVEGLLRDSGPNIRDLVEQYYIDNPPPPPRPRRRRNQPANVPARRNVVDSIDQIMANPSPEANQIPRLRPRGSIVQIVDNPAPVQNMDNPAPRANPIPVPPVPIAIPNPPAPRPNPVPAPRLHQRVHIPPTEKKEYPQKRCRECYKKKIRKETRCHCEVCPEKPGLCEGTCFDDYHERLKRRTSRAARTRRRTTARRNVQQIQAANNQPAVQAASIQPAVHATDIQTADQVANSQPGPSSAPQFGQASGNQEESRNQGSRQIIPSLATSRKRRPPRPRSSVEKKSRVSQPAKKQPDASYQSPSDGSDFDSPDTTS